MLGSTWGRQRALFRSQSDQKQVGPREMPFVMGRGMLRRQKNVPTSWQGQPALPGSASLPTLAGESASLGARRQSSPQLVQARSSMSYTHCCVSQMPSQSREGSTELPRAFPPPGFRVVFQPSWDTPGPAAESEELYSTASPVWHFWESGHVERQTWAAKGACQVSSSRDGEKSLFCMV